MSTSNPLGGNASHGTAPDHAADCVDAGQVMEARHDATRHDPVSPRQVAPIPHIEIEQEHLDPVDLVREAINDHPGASADDIVRLLEEKQIHVSATLVMQQLAGSDQANSGR